MLSDLSLYLGVTSPPNKWTINYLEDGFMKTVTFIGTQLELATALYMYKQVMEVRRVYD